MLCKVMLRSVKTAESHLPAVASITVDGTYMLLAIRKDDRIYRVCSEAQRECP